MLRKTRWVGLVVVLLSAALVVSTGCSGAREKAQQGDVSKQGEKLSGTITVAGSTAMQPLIEEAAKKFMARHTAVFGEAAALLFTAGMTTPHLDFGQLNILHSTSPWNPFRPGETLAVHIWKVNSEALIPDIRRVADGSAAVLLLVVLAFNLLARWTARRLRSRLEGR